METLRDADFVKLVKELHAFATSAGQRHGAHGGLEPDDLR
jgi:hypothetical protein